MRPPATQSAGGFFGGYFSVRPGHPARSLAAAGRAEIRCQHDHIESSADYNAAILGHSRARMIWTGNCDGRKNFSGGSANGSACKTIRIEPTKCARRLSRSKLAGGLTLQSVRRIRITARPASVQCGGMWCATRPNAAPVKPVDGPADGLKDDRVLITPSPAATGSILNWLSTFS
jgi:hypothetical protein